MPEAALMLVTLVSTVASARTAQPAEPIAWADVGARYAAVTDYTCLYEKQERAIANGELQRIRLWFRKPLDVRLEWLDDRGRVDQVAVYRQGFNGGKLIARRSGILGSVVGTVRLDPRDKRALTDSRHPITEVGLGHIIDQIGQNLRDRRIGSRAPVSDTLDGEAAYRFEFEALQEGPLFGLDGVRRAVVWVARSVKLPVNVEIVDASGALIERHRFTDLRLDVGLTDATFTL